jgi:hypothetical protein
VVEEHFLGQRGALAQGGLADDAKLPKMTHSKRQLARDRRQRTGDHSNPVV